MVCFLAGNRWGRGEEPAGSDGYSRHPTHAMSRNPHNKQPGEVGTIVFLSDEETGPERLGDLPEATQLGRGRARITPDRPIPDLSPAAAEE